MNNEAAPEPRPPVRTDDPSPVRYGSAMLRRFGWFYYILGLGAVLSRFAMREHSVDRVRSAAVNGPIVYVMFRPAAFDHLALNTVLNQRRLPLSVWANGITNFFWQPVIDAWTDVWTRTQALLTRGFAPDPVKSGWLSREINRGSPVTVFLAHRRTPWQWLTRQDAADPLDVLMAAQRNCDRPIQLIPVLVLWDRSPETKRHPFRQFLLGNRLNPGLYGRFREVYLTRDRVVQMGEPLDLSEFMRRAQPTERTRTLRTLLRRYLKREMRVVSGPQLLPRRELKRLVLNNPPMRRLARKTATETGRSVDSVSRELSRTFDSVAANFRFGTIRLLHVALRPVWTRIFSGVDIRDEDLERLREAAREGTLVLVPCHKSHFDYVLISWVAYHHELVVPHIVAGMNLAIWPLHYLLRSAGALFIKRSFKDDPIFPAVFSRYLRELIRQGYPVEFFIEGGRTRTGRLMSPRKGVLEMVLDAAQHRKEGRDVLLMPVALAYEQVAEEGVYTRELGGEAKKAESIGEVLKVRSVLGRRYGRVYMRVGEPIRCAAIVDESAGTPRWSRRDPADNDKTLDRVARKVVHEIGKAMVVLPTSLVSLALLAHHRRSIRHTDLVERVGRYRAFLARYNASEANSLVHFDQAIGQALDRFLRAKQVSTLEHEQQRMWAVAPDQRLALDFYKNQILHFFAPAAIAASVIRGQGEDAFTRSDLLEGFTALAELLTREFTFDPDLSLEALLKVGLDALEAHGAVSRKGGWYRVAQTTHIAEIYGLLRSLIEAYVLVLRSASRGKDKAKLVSTLLDDQANLIAAGIIRWPEALSKVTLGNAVSAFLTAGLFEVGPGGFTVNKPRVEATLVILTPMVE